MIASLPMYDRPDLREATDRYWALVRDGLRARGLPAPDALTRDDREPFDHWLDPGLVLSQTCGFPFRARLHDRVTLVGTPDFGVEGCPPGHYCSVIVTRADDPRGLDDLAGAPFAYNDPLSQSGWAALATWRPDLPTGPRLRTGAHRASALAIAEGRADFAALDAVTWTLLAAAEPVAQGLRVVARTPPTPGLPYITAAGRDPAPLFAAAAEAVERLDAADRAALRLRGIVAIPAAAYLAVPTPPAP